jgi:hypothetical protein
MEGEREYFWNGSRSDAQRSDGTVRCGQLERRRTKAPRSGAEDDAAAAATWVVVAANRLGQRLG